jgi:uncharacterized protein with beta-barrel porin domain
MQSPNYSERILNLEAAREQSIATLETVYLKKKSLKGTIYGIVTNKSGFPVSNALVVLCNANNSPVQVTYTNEKGIYMFYLLELGTYTVLAK